MKRKVLTPQQKKAISFLLQGFSDIEVGKKIQVASNTVWRWKQTEIFQRALEESRAGLQQKIDIIVSKKTIGLIEKSKEALAEMLEQREKKFPGYVKVALEILKIYRPSIDETKQQSAESEKISKPTIESTTVPATELLQEKIVDDDQELVKQIEAVYGKTKPTETN